MVKTLTICCVLGWSAALGAQSLKYDFSQSGFSEGATVSGFFIAEDRDGNGRVSSLEDEVSDFQMSFSGNSLVPAFNMRRDDLQGLVYVLDGGPLGDDDDAERGEGIRARSGANLYVIGPGPDEFAGILCGQGVSCSEVTDGVGTDSSPELVLVSPRDYSMKPSIPARKDGSPEGAAGDTERD